MRQYAVVYCTALLDVAVCYSILHYVVRCGSMPQYAAPKLILYAIRYSARIAHLAAKCRQILQNASKFFPNDITITRARQPLLELDNRLNN